jgi:hypothetical protein
MYISVIGQGADANFHNTIVPFDEWSHIAVTYNRDNSRISVYINGEFRDDDGVNTMHLKNDCDLSFGARAGTGTSEYFTGSLAEMAYIEDLLSPEDVLSIYDNGVIGSGVNDVFALYDSGLDDSIDGHNLEIISGSITIDSGGDSQMSCEDPGSGWADNADDTDDSTHDICESPPESIVMEPEIISRL